MWPSSSRALDFALCGKKESRCLQMQWSEELRRSEYPGYTNREERQKQPGEPCADDPGSPCGCLPCQRVRSLTSSCLFVCLPLLPWPEETHPSSLA